MLPPMHSLTTTLLRSTVSPNNALLTDGEVLAQVDSAFAQAPRPEHFAERPLDLERKDHDDLLRSRTRETLRISDVEMLGYNPINCMTPEAFRYFFPKL